MVKANLGVRSNPGRYDRSTQLVNCYAEDAGEDAKSRYSILVSEGTKSFATLSNGGATRGMKAVDTTLVVVSGRVVFEVSAAGDVTSIGGLAGDGSVYIARNRATPTQTVLVANGEAHLLQSGALSRISDPDLPPPVGVEFFFGYFVFPIADGRFFISALDSVDVDALDFATAEANPDGLVRAVRRQSELWLFGPQSVEIWGLSADADFPLERLPGAFIDVGCASGASVAVVDRRVVWVASDDTVRLAQQYGADIISPPKLTTLIRAISDKSTLQATQYAADGHNFYVLRSASWTWVYDLATGFWHERESAGLDFWRVSHVERFAGKNIGGDHLAGTLYEIDQETYTDAGSDLVMRIRTPIIHDYPNPISIGSLHLDVAPGRGINSTDSDDSDPQITMRTSVDGGLTWGTWRSASMGKQGEYAKRVSFNSLGTSKEDGFVVEITAASATARALTGAAIENVEVHEA